MTVYAPQEPLIKNMVTGIYEPNRRYNLDALRKFGDIQFCWPNGSQVWARYETMQHARAIAQKFSSEHDWVVNLGSPTLMYLLGWAIGAENKPLRILEWDGRINDYVPIILNRKEEEDGITK